MKFMKTLRQFLTGKEDVRTYINKAKRKKSKAKGRNNAEATAKRKLKGDARHSTNRIVSGVDVYLDPDLARPSKFKVNKAPRADGYPNCNKCGHNKFKTTLFDDVGGYRYVECRNPECKQERRSKI